MGRGKGLVSYSSGLLKSDPKWLNRRAGSLPKIWVFLKGTDWRKKGEMKNLNLEEVGWVLVTDPRHKRDISLSLLYECWAEHPGSAFLHKCCEIPGMTHTQ